MVDPFAFGTSHGLSEEDDQLRPVQSEWKQSTERRTPRRRTGFSDTLPGVGDSLSTQKIAANPVRSST
jgi:hypothetical protein